MFEWEGYYHLYFLQSNNVHNDHIGHAVSRDLFHWEACPAIPTQGKPGEWNHGRTATGMVIEHDGVFYMHVGGYDPATTDGYLQVVGTMVSHDLTHWEVSQDHALLYPKPPYVNDPRDDCFQTVDWRDMHVVWHEDDQQYHAFLCAKMPGSDHNATRAAVAHLQSRDLMSWAYRPPIAISDQFSNMEVPQAFEFNGMYYLVFSTNSLTGLRLHTPTRDSTRGTYYMMSRTLEGPYELPDDPLLIGCSNSRFEGAYSARSIAYGDERILYHHTGGSECAYPTWGPPKRMITQDDGTLKLMRLPGIEVLESEVLIERDAPLHKLSTLGLGEWRVNQNQITGGSKIAGTSCLLAEVVGDLHLSCDITATNTPAAATTSCAGVIFREHDGKGIALILDYRQGQLHLATTEIPGDYGGAWSVFGINFAPLDTLRHPLHHGQTYRICIYARAEVYEVYVDDAWCFSFTSNDVALQGDIRFYVEQGQATLGSLRIATLKPLDKPSDVLLGQPTIDEPVASLAH